jgi:hypothetical protein
VFLMTVTMRDLSLAKKNKLWIEFGLLTNFIICTQGYPLKMLVQI